MLTEPLIQIAGIIDRKEADLIRSCGVHYLGFPLRLPVNQEDLAEDEAAKIIRSLTPPDFGVVITYLDRAEEIARFCEQMGTNIVQLHGEISVVELQKLKSLVPGLTVIKSLVVGRHDEDALAAMVEQLSPFVEAFITDTFDADTGADGATGKTHDWSVSRRLVEQSSRPVILAGGLTPENVREAILTVKPAGVDSHTGVEESSGRKCREKVKRFVDEARRGFAQLKSPSVDG